MFIKQGARFRIIQVSNDLSNLNVVGFPKLASQVQAIEPILRNPEKFLYLRNRAVSAYETHGPNDNNDAFEREELLKSFATFIGSPVNFDHKNTSIEESVGVVISATWLPLVYSDSGSIVKTSIPLIYKESKILTETGFEVVGDYVENILALDKKEAEARKPGILDRIMNGKVEDSSMGCIAQISVCSHCKNIASTPEEYCDCIRGHKGDKKFAIVKHASGREYGPFEYNRKVAFFEETVVTEDRGADKYSEFTIITASHSVSILVPFIINRYDQIIKEASMGNKVVAESVAVKDLKVNEPDKTSYVDVSGDKYGKGTDKDKELAQEAKGKSVVQKDHKGAQNESMTDTGDYVLANIKGASVMVKKSDLAKLAEDLGKSNVVTLGGEPEEITLAEEKINDAKADQADKKQGEDSKEKGEKQEKLDEGIDEVKDEMKAVAKLFRAGHMDEETFVKTVEAIQKKHACPAEVNKEHEKSEVPAEEILEHEDEEKKILSSINDAAKKSTLWEGIKKVVTSALSKKVDGPLLQDGAVDTGDYGVDPKAQEKVMIDKQRSTSESNIKAQNADTFDTAEKRESKERLLKSQGSKKTAKIVKTAEQANKALNYITDQLTKGKPFKEAEKEAYEMYGEESNSKEASLEQRIAARKKLAQDIMIEQSADGKVRVKIDHDKNELQDTMNMGDTNPVVEPAVEAPVTEPSAPQAESAMPKEDVVAMRIKKREAQMRLLASEDIANAVSTPDDIASGNQRTKVSPATKSVVGDSMVRKEAAENSEVQQGNIDTVASPATKEVVGEGNEALEVKNDADTTGNRGFSASTKNPRIAAMLKLQEENEKLRKNNSIMASTLKEKDVLDIVNAMNKRSMIQSIEHAKSEAAKLRSMDQRSLSNFREAIMRVPEKKEEVIRKTSSFNEVAQGLGAVANRDTDSEVMSEAFGG